MTGGIILVYFQGFLKEDKGLGMIVQDKILYSFNEILFCLY